MNDLSTVKPLYPGAFPVPQDDDADAAYPKAPLNLILGFDLETWLRTAVQNSATVAAG